jgi:hypothetical protein
MWSTPRPDRFIPGRYLVPIVQEVGWASQPLWRAQKFLPPPVFTPSNPQQVTALCSLKCPFVQLSRLFIQSYSIAQVTGSPGFNSTVVRIGFVVVKMALQQVSVTSIDASDCTTDVILPLMLHIHLLFWYLSSNTNLFHTSLV